MDDEIRERILAITHERRWERWSIADTYWSLRREGIYGVSYEQVRAVVNAEKERRGDVISYAARDTQRARLYRWEGGIRREHEKKAEAMSLKACDTLIAEAYALFGREWRGEVRPGKDDGRFARGNAAIVTLPKTWARVPSVVLHEASHGILHLLRAEHKAWGKWPPHGPQFATIMVSLWDSFDVVRAATAIEEAKPYKIQFADEPQFKVLPHIALQELAADERGPLS